jgi:hypothetical protein
MNVPQKEYMVQFDSPLLYKHYAGESGVARMYSALKFAADFYAASLSFTGVLPLPFDSLGPEYQSEVALLSRRIVLQGDTGSAADNSFGGHSMVSGTQATGRISGVQADRMGQLNVLGRYPFHFHMMRGSAGAAVLISICRCNLRSLYNH